MEGGTVRGVQMGYLPGGRGRVVKKRGGTLFECLCVAWGGGGVVKRLF